MAAFGGPSAGVSNMVVHGAGFASASVLKHAAGTRLAPVRQTWIIKLMNLLEIHGRSGRDSNPRPRRDRRKYASKESQPVL